MENQESYIKEITHCLARELDARSILCYGSYAHGLHDEKSDRDLLLLTDEKIPSHNARRLAYEKIPNLQILSLDKKNLGDWDNSWSPINDQLQVGNQVLDIGYNTVVWVNQVIKKLIYEHQITFDAFPFRPYTFLGLLETSQIFFDKEGFIEKCRTKIRPMPKELKEKIIKAFLPQLQEYYQDLLDCAERAIGILAFEHFLFRGLDALIQLLFVMNEVYDPASKRTEAFLFKLKKLPKDLDVFINTILPRFYENKREVCDFFKEAIHFITTSTE